MEFSGAAQPDTSDITSSTKFTAHFNRPPAQQARRQATKSRASPALSFSTPLRFMASRYASSPCRCIPARSIAMSPGVSVAPSEAAERCTAPLFVDRSALAPATRRAALAIGTAFCRSSHHCRRRGRPGVHNLEQCQTSPSQLRPARDGGGDDVPRCQAWRQSPSWFKFCHRT